ncbi:cytosine permease [Celerinatantimonas yamalensis]|uniref:Cytosine permease n=2 Tax=Celerinatantimonas yamalensis TaxID=559956 RepID=A0ABW9G8F1_9GAMM
MSDELYSAREKVSDDNKLLQQSDFFALWLSLGIGLAVLQTGALVAPGLGLRGAVWVIVIGSSLGALLLAVIGLFGQQQGLSSMALMQRSLGHTGSYIPALLNLLQLIGWGAFEIVLMRSASVELCKQWFPTQSWLSSSLLWTALFGALATWQAVLGPLTWVRVLLRRFGRWIVLSGCTGLTAYWLAHYSLTQLWLQAGDGSMPIGLGLDIVISMAVSWLPLVADYTRFGQSGKSAFNGTALGFWVGTIWIMVLGAAYALVLGSGDQLMRSLALAMAGFPLLLILCDETENAFAPIHSAAVSASLFASLRTWHLALGFGVVSTLIAWLIPTQAYLDFLLWIGSVFVPLFALLLVDYGSRSHSVKASKFQVLAALFAWIIGVVIYHLVSDFYSDWGATLPSLLITALIYAGLRWLPICKFKQPESAS